MNTTVYLIRHGEIDNPKGISYGGTLDLPLNSKGRLQMSDLGELLQKEGIRPNVIYTSHLSRAKESGQILAEKFGINVIEDERLGDNRIPRFAGLTQTEKESKFPGRDEFDSTLEGHESKEEVLGRMRSAFDDIVKSQEGKTIFIVSHGDPLKLLLYSLNHFNESEIPSIDDLPQIEKGNAIRTVMEESRMIECEFVSPNELRDRKGKEL